MPKYIVLGFVLISFIAIAKADESIQKQPGKVSSEFKHTEINATEKKAPIIKLKFVDSVELSPGTVRVDSQKIGTAYETLDLIGPENNEFGSKCVTAEWGGTGCTFWLQKSNKVELKELAFGTVGGDGGDDSSSTLWIVYNRKVKSFDFILRTVAYGEKELGFNPQDTVFVFRLKAGSEIPESVDLNAKQEKEYKKKFPEAAHRK